MSARRFHVGAFGAVGDDITLPEGVVRHVAVLRLPAGAEIEIFDGAGRVAHAVLVGPRGDIARIIAVADATRQREHVELIQCLPKSAKIETIVRMTTEVGVDAITLVSSERTVRKLDDGRADRALTRLRTIAEEASRQSERSAVPTIEGVVPLAERISVIADDAVKLTLSPRTDDTLESAVGNGARQVAIVVGPEGGLSDREESLLERSGFVRVRLGDHVLRTETAGVVAVALVIHELGRAKRSKSPHDR